MPVDLDGQGTLGTVLHELFADGHRELPRVVEVKNCRVILGTILINFFTATDGSLITECLDGTVKANNNEPTTW